jgi:acyl dehydratase
MRDYYHDTWIEDGNAGIGYRKTGWFEPKQIKPRRLADIQQGAQIAGFTQGPVTRTEIVKYAAASWDFNPIHHDETFAQKARSGGIIAHGMMIFAYLGRIATDYLGQPELQKLSARFMNVTRPGDVLTLNGQVIEVVPAKGGGNVVLALKAVNQKGETVATGLARAFVPA